MKKILILGAGTYQVPLIRRALARGLHVIAASWSADDPGMALAHEMWVVSTTDKERILQLAKNNGIDAIATTGTDVAVPTIGLLCDELRLPGVSYATALCTSDKVLMQEKLSQAGVPTARHKRVTTLEEAKAAVASIGLPVVVKAPDSSGSRGITAVDTLQDLDDAFTAAMEVSRSGQALVEEQLTGEEFGAQAIVQDGRVVQCICHNDTVTPPPVTVPIGHSCPSMLPTETQQETAAVCQLAVTALDIGNAICNVDLILTSKGVRVFEIGARIGATGIPEIIALHHRLDLYDVALSMALGQRQAIALSTGPAAAALIIKSPGTGRLARCAVTPRAESIPGLISVGFDYAVGASVNEFRTGPDRIGAVFATAPSAAGAEQACQRITDRLDIAVAPQA